MEWRKKAPYFLIIIYLLILAGLSLTPIRVKVVPFSGWDKVVHFLMYIPLGFFLCFTPKTSSFFLTFLVPLSFGSLYGAMMELLQSFVPGRSPSFYDGLANFFGVGMGIFLGYAQGRAMEKRKGKERNLGE